MRFWIPQEKILGADSRFQTQKFNGFWNLDALTWGNFFEEFVQLGIKVK